MKRLFGKYMQLVKFERIDTEPTKELLAPYGFTRGFVIWVPFRRTAIPVGWRKLVVGTHFTRTGYIEIDGSEYYKKWNERARRARKKFLSLISGENHEDIHIDMVDEETFVQAFQQVKVKHLYKSDYVRYYRAMKSLGGDSVRSYVCYQGQTPIAGLAVHDYSGNASVHLVAFTGKEAKPFQAGTGLMDRWFQDSVDLGIKYINFDHLRDSSMETSQQGYTDFKLNFMENECYFRESYFRFL